MTESRKGMGATGMFAVIAALVVGLVVVGPFLAPTGSNRTGPVEGPKPLLGLVSTKDVHCALGTGTCTMTVVNNSTAELQLQACQVLVIISANSTHATWVTDNGAVGGPAIHFVPASASASGTCTVPTADLYLQNPDSFDGLDVSGNLSLKLLTSGEEYPAGSQTSIGFDGTWA